MKAIAFTRPQLEVLLGIIEARWEGATPRGLRSLNLAEVKIRAALRQSAPKWPMEAARFK